MRISQPFKQTPTEYRFLIEDGDRSTWRFIFLPENASPVLVMKMMAENINHYFRMKEDGFPYDYNEEAHIAGILADSARYGTD